MRRRDRSINIFSLSLLDVISGALGAFLIVMVILLPFYDRESIDYQREIRELEAQAAAADERAESAEQRLAEIRFLLFSIRWSTTRHDVDLIVVDPSGAEFNWQRRTAPGRPGELTQDDRSGPGLEMWKIHDAPPGEYRFYATLYQRHGNPQNARVEARLTHRDGLEEFPPLELTEERERVPVAVVTVQENGDVLVRAR